MQALLAVVASTMSPSSYPPRGIADCLPTDFIEFLMGRRRLERASTERQLAAWLAEYEPSARARAALESVTAEDTGPAASPNAEAFGAP